MKVIVRLNSQLVGRLSLTKRRTCLFEYDRTWVEKGFSISPFFLPLKQQVFEAQFEPFDGLFGVFADSISVLGKGKPSRKDMLALAAEIDFPIKKMQKIIDEVFDVCLSSEIGYEIRKRNL